MQRDVVPGVGPKERNPAAVPMTKRSGDSKVLKQRPRSRRVGCPPSKYLSSLSLTYFMLRDVACFKFGGGVYIVYIVRVHSMYSAPLCTFVHWFA